MANSTRSEAGPAGPTARQPWSRPEIKDLPRLSELTLQTGGAIDGGIGTGGGGSTVF